MTKIEHFPKELRPPTKITKTLIYCWLGFNKLSSVLTAINFTSYYVTIRARITLSVRVHRARLLKRGRLQSNISFTCTEKTSRKRVQKKTNTNKSCRYIRDKQRYQPFKTAFVYTDLVTENGNVLIPSVNIIDSSGAGISKRFIDSASINFIHSTLAFLNHWKKKLCLYNCIKCVSEYKTNPMYMCVFHGRSYIRMYISASWS